MKEQLLNHNQHMQSPTNRKVRHELQNQHFKDALLTLEGQCKIKQITYLRINHIKAILLTIIFTISIVGLFLLKYFKKLRAMVFYDTLQYQQVDQITHIYIKGSEKQEQISCVETIKYQNQERLIFQFKKLRYELYGQKFLPVGLAYMKDINQLNSDNFIRVGLNNLQIQKKLNLFGRNEHNVEVPTYPEYLFDTMTQPFFLFQYFVSLIYALQNLFLFSMLMIVFGFLTTTINYFLLRKSYNKIKQTAEKRFQVQVLRNGKFQQIQNTELVPGDLFIPSLQIPCDSIVVRGDLFVDQVSLTGETVPIPKFAVVDERKVNEKSHWLFQGSKLQTMKPNTLALAINVGYGSRRGRIIRKILTRSTKQPQFFIKIIYFQIEVLIVSIILYLVTLPNILPLKVDRELIIIRFGDFITYSFPAPYPIFFNLAYSFCLVRLNKSEILGTQPEKTVEGSRLRTMCFDKTGTLTYNKMQVCKVYIPQGPNDFKDITLTVKQQKMIVDCFATCNSVQQINGQIKGDQIDMRLFEFVNSRLQTSNKSGVVREVLSKNSVAQVLKINQYESQFQSMSVLIKNPSTGKYFIFVKGNPQMIHKFSSTKYAGFANFIKKMSFSGYRSIGCAYKEIRPEEVSLILNASRQQYLMDTKLLGVVTFVNKLKDDSFSTIQTLASAGISTKIITGDNIYLGIQTAFATGMIANDKKVIVVEGSKYDKTTNQLISIELTRNQDGTFSEQQRTINNFCYLQEDDTIYAIDNDFIAEKGQDFLDTSVKVFARISPQNKALIVKKHKQIEKQAVNKRKGLEKLFGDCSYKVGMVGDGANDLIAIKQADLGIGISSSDAIYSASFAVTELNQIVRILCQSKNSQRQINQMAKYYGITQFLSIVLTLIMTSDYSYFTSIELIYKNFFNTLLLTLFYGRSKPAQKLTKKTPNSNFLDLQNHIIFWGNTIICSLGFIISYAYYQSTDDYQPNSQQQAHFPDGWSSQSKTSTINFLAANVVFIFLPIFIYQSKPWKKPIWTNKAMSILIILNIIMLGIICYSTQSLKDYTIQPIRKKQMSVVIVIMLVSCLLCGALNYTLQWWNLRKQDSKRELNQERSLEEY